VETRHITVHFVLTFAWFTPYVIGDYKGVIMLRKMKNAFVDHPIQWTIIVLSLVWEVILIAAFRKMAK